MVINSRVCSLVRGKLHQPYHSFSFIAEDGISLLAMLVLKKLLFWPSAVKLFNSNLKFYPNENSS